MKLSNKIRKSLMIFLIPYMLGVGGLKAETTKNEDNFPLDIGGYKAETTENEDNFPLDIGGYKAETTKNEDNLPLELGKYGYTVRLDKKGWEDKIAGRVDFEIKKQDNEYLVDLKLNSSAVVSALGKLENYTHSKFFYSPETSSYRSLECIVQDRVKLFHFLSIPGITSTKREFHFSYPQDSPHSDISLKMGKKKLEVPYNTQDPLTMTVNLLSMDHDITGNILLGKVKGRNKKEPEDIYANITREDDNGYSAELTFPEDTIMDDKSSFKIHYKLKENGKIELERLDLFVKKNVNCWAIATFDNSPK
ncbi:MAG: hypothetical protein KKA64_00965 [Nanoarchaeota archaeon]|nr:hypothetical protein [Nanoarchaeota archaeon]